MVALIIGVVCLLVSWVIMVSTPEPYDYSSPPSKGETPPLKEEYGESTYLGGNDGYVHEGSAQLQVQESVDSSTR